MATYRISNLFSPGNEGYLSLHDFEICPAIWDEVLSMLADDNCWDTIRILLTGNDVISPVAKSICATKVQLHGLLEFCDTELWKEWGQKLSVKLLHNGAKYETLAKDGKHGLHAAFNIGMKTGKLREMSS